ncbi:MAG: hypothetical protein K6G47_02245 [Clostridia bacterium]|nr:hypothetical protein [Clostridia bacterium]
MKCIKLFAAVMAVSVACGIFAGCNKKDTSSSSQESNTSSVDIAEDSNVGDSYLEGEEAVTALLNATMKDDVSLAKDMDPSIKADETVVKLRKLVAGDFIHSSGFDIPDPTEAELTKVNSIMDYIYGKTSCDLASNTNETVASYTAPNNLPEVINNAVADAAASYDGDTEKAFSDPKFFDLFLDAFINRENELKIEGGPSLTISNDDYVNGVYDLLYGMLGFYDIL